MMPNTWAKYKIFAAVPLIKTYIFDVDEKILYVVPYLKVYQSVCF